MIQDLTQLNSGQKGTVAEIQGGMGVVRRLESMGIRPGKKITKVSAQFLRGPQIVRVNNSQVALGFGMARKVLVEVEG
jgi:ferrous iron transport protein A